MYTYCTQNIHTKNNAVSSKFLNSWHAFLVNKLYLLSYFLVKIIVS